MINKEQFKLLHSIRGLAALIVVIAHAKFPFWCGGQEYVAKYPLSNWNIFDYLVFAIDMFTSNATVMVIIFFVLSGFFIAHSFETNAWKKRHFYVNRTIRIYIPYIGSLILTVILFKLATLINPELFISTSPREYNQDLVIAYENFNLKSFLWSLLFIADPMYIGYNNPYWSLLIEAMFYIIAPFFIKRPKLFLIITSFLFLTEIIVPNSISKIINIGMLSKFLTTFSIFFAMGYFCYYLIFKYKIQNKVKKINVMYFNITAIVLFASAMFGGFFVDSKYTYLVGGLFTVVTIYRMIVYPMKITIFNKFFISMGKISYSMYLIHVPIFILLYSLLVKFTGVEVFYTRIYWFGVVIAVGISYLFYYAVEHQSLKLIKKFKEKIKPKTKNSQLKTKN